VLVITRKTSESILIGDNIEIVVTDIGSERVKIGINAPKGVPILRGELLETCRLNQEAGTGANKGTVGELARLLNVLQNQEENG
jgi:carbon storage regulator